MTEFYGPMDSRETFLERIASARNIWAGDDLQVELLELLIHAVLDVRELLRAQSEATLMASEALNAMRADPAAAPIPIVVQDGRATIPRTAAEADSTEGFCPRCAAYAHEGDCLNAPASAVAPDFESRVLADSAAAPPEVYGLSGFVERIEAARMEGRHLARREMRLAIEDFFGRVFND